MKETRYLIYIEEKDFFHKVSKEGEWIFTSKKSEAKKYDTVLGAFIRLTDSRELDELKKLKASILIEETITEEDGTTSSRISGGLVYKTMKGRGRPRKEADDEEEKTESKIILPEVDPNKVRKLNEGTEPKRKGRPRKETPTTTVKTNNVITNGEPLAKKATQKTEELKTEIVDTDLNVVVQKVSESDSFWD